MALVQAVERGGPDFINHAPHGTFFPAALGQPGRADDEHHEHTKTDDAFHEVPPAIARGRRGKKAGVVAA